MSGFEDSAGLSVNNHYGQREIGGQQGRIGTVGIENEAVVNFDGQALDFPVVIPAGAIVTHVIDGFATGAVATALVGAVDIAAADGTELAYVAVPAGGDLVVTGPTAGDVVVKYLFTV